MTSPVKHERTSSRARGRVPRGVAVVPDDEDDARCATERRDDRVRRPSAPTSFPHGRSSIAARCVSSTSSLVTKGRRRRPMIVEIEGVDHELAALRAIVGDVNGLIAEEDIVDLTARSRPASRPASSCSSRPGRPTSRPRSTLRPGVCSRACASRPKSSTKSRPTSSTTAVRREHAVVTDLLPSWNDTPACAADHRLRDRGHDRRQRRRSSRRKRASRRSTTTARCGARSRCRSSSTSPSTALAELRDADAVAPRRSSRSKAGVRAGLAWLAGVDGEALPRRRPRHAVARRPRSRGIRRHDRRRRTTRASRTSSRRDHPTLERRVPRCGYQPMVELMRYLEANDSPSTSPPAAIATSCEQIAKAIYGIPPERVIGSSMTLDYQETGDGRHDRSTRRRWSSWTTGRRSRSGSGAASAAAR